MNLVEPILSGMLFGLIISVLVGPVFFTLIQTSLQEGFKAGAHLAFGVMLSDAAYIVLSYFFASQIHIEGGNKLLVGIIGGIILMGFGVFQATKKIKTAEINQPARAVHARYAVKGFLMNATNPSVILFWLSAVSQVKLRENYKVIHEASFFVMSLVTVFGIDLAKSYASHRIKKFLKPQVLKWINHTAGIVLVVYGGWMIGKALKWWG